MGFRGAGLRFRVPGRVPDAPGAPENFGKAQQTASAFGGHCRERFVGFLILLKLLHEKDHVCVCVSVCVCVCVCVGVCSCLCACLHVTRCAD